MDRRLFLKLITLAPTAAFFGCKQEDTKKEETKAPAAQPVDVRITTLKGPTAMGLAKFMSDVKASSITDNSYTFDIVASPDEVVAKVAKGDVDIASIPSNLSSVLYNKTEGKVQALCINVLNVLYIVERGNAINSIHDLAGKTLYAAGKGASPEYVLAYILKKNGLELGKDVSVEWKSEHAECVAALASDEFASALLPQPFVSVAQAKDSSIREALDLGNEWKAIDSTSELVTGVTIVSKDFAEKNPDAITQFLSHYKDSVEFANDHVDEAAKLIADADIVPEKIAKVALPKCNITYIAGDDMKQKLSGYLGVLADANPKSVGGKLPEDDFYFGVKKSA